MLWTAVLLIEAVWCYALTGQVRVEWLLLYTVVIATVVFAASRYGDFANEPRYLWPIFSATPLWIGRLQQLPTRRPLRPLRLVSVTIALFIIVNLYTLVNLIPTLNQPWVDGAPYPVDMQPLLNHLAAQNIAAAYADYWICNRLLFESRTGVKCAVINEMTPSGVKMGWNRYLPYAAAVTQAAAPAWIFVADTATERAFATWLQETDVTYARTAVDGYAVYSHLSRRIVPLD